MDTRRASASGESFRPGAELGTETVPIDLVELVELRYVVTPRGGAGLKAMVSALVLLAAVATIATLAIATSGGWSVLDAY
jgi:hypothetical protein